MYFTVLCKSCIFKIISFYYLSYLSKQKCGTILLFPLIFLTENNSWLWIKINATNVYFLPHLTMAFINKFKTIKKICIVVIMRKYPLNFTNILSMLLMSTALQIIFRAVLIYSFLIFFYFQPNHTELSILVTWFRCYCTRNLINNKYI